MKLDPILTRASRLARSGKYEAAIRSLEPEVNRYHGTFQYYYLLGVSCLHTGDFGGALTYLRLAHEVKMRDPLALLGLAVLYLRRSETGRAVDLYLETLEYDEKNRTAKNALKVIRKHARADTFSAWLESGKLSSLYPPIPFAGFSFQELAGFCLAFVLVCTLVFGILVRARVLPNPLKPRGNRQGITEFALSREEQMEPVQTGGSYRYIMTRTQALETYEKALSLFTTYRDEAARISLNRLLESNAAEGLKNKSRIILSYAEVPGFDTFRRSDNVPYADVIKDPALYRDVHVIWRGMATNVDTSQNVTLFDFLVGYDTRKTLEGIVPVTFDQAVALNPERPMEVLGRIVPVSGEGPIRLEGVAIHQSGRLENPGP
jgi:tetratricopeptide (TPR) repeat protein